MPLAKAEPYPVLPRGFVYSTTKSFAAKFWNIQLNATLYIENGPPWISRINGYFFEASNDGGLTTQPWTFVFPVDVYQTSSTFAICFPASTSPFTSVSLVILPGCRRFTRTMSCGCSGSASVPAAFKSCEAESNVSTWVPVVTALTPPLIDANCTLREPRSSASK